MTVQDDLIKITLNANPIQMKLKKPLLLLFNAWIKFKYYRKF